MPPDAPLEVTVALAPPLYAACTEALGGKVEAMLARTVDDLHLPRLPVVEVEERDVPFVRMEVDGRACRYPETVIPECTAYVTGDAAVTPVADADELLARLADAGSPVDELVELVCRSAVWSGPGVLAPRAMGRASLDLGVPVDESLRTAAVKIHVERGYLRELTSNERAGEMFEFLRSELPTELGIRLPQFRFVADPALRRSAFALQINAAWTIPRIALPAGTLLVNCAVAELPEFVDGARATTNPSIDRPATIVPARYAVDLEAAGFTTWDPLGYLILVLATALRRWAPALIGTDAAESAIMDLSRAFPLAAAEAERLGDEGLARLLRELVGSGVSVRNLRRIAQLLAREPALREEEAMFDTVTFVRTGLADQLGHRFSRGTDTVVVYLIHADIERAVDESAGGDWPFTPLGERVCDALRHEAALLPATAQRPVVLTPDELRKPMLQALRVEHPLFEVIGFGDLPPDCNVQPVARINWPEADAEAAAEPPRA